MDLDEDLLQRMCPANIGDTVSVINPKAARPSEARANKTLRRNGEFGELAPRNMLALYLRILDHHPHGNNVHEVLVPGQGVMKVGIEHITFYENESTTPMLYDADDPLTTNDIDKDVKGLRMQYERNRAEAKSKVSDPPEHNGASTDDDLTTRKHKPNEFTHGSGGSGNMRVMVNHVLNPQEKLQRIIIRLDATVDRNRNRITHFLQGRNTVSVSVCTAGTVDRNPLCDKYPLWFPVSVAPTVTVDRNRSRITKKSNPVSVSVFPAVTETFLPRNQFREVWKLGSVSGSLETRVRHFPTGI